MRGPACTLVLLALLAGISLLATACASTPMPTGGPVRVVAAENVWGSIAAQVGGTRASTQSVIVDPSQDPHSYEPTAQDARTLATAQLAIVNGIGYDPWAPKLLAANPTPGRIVLTVGSVLGRGEGDNPHRWYDPADVDAVANAISADLKRLDPKHAVYFDRQLKTFETTGLARYHMVIAQIRARYRGVPVGASESIFAPQAPALGLRLLTPPSLMKSISEGTEVRAQDMLTTQRQITSHQIKVWIYNSQNTTPAIQRLTGLARAAHLPTVTITETLDPPRDSFEQWQVGQLQRLEQALREATGR